MRSIILCIAAKCTILVEMTPFQQAKLAIVENAGLAKDALHIYVAVIVFFGACLVFGWKSRQWKPWLAVLVVSLTGEIWDMHGSYLHNGDVWVAHGLKDVVNSMVVPTVLVLASRYTKVFD